MPATFKKATLRPGRYQSPDGTVVVTPKRLKHWAAQHQKLLAAGNVIPVDWDHPEDPSKATPLSIDDFKTRVKKRSAKNTIGLMKGFRLGKDDQGDFAEIELQLGRQRAIEAADANDIFVSPVIFNQWKDGAGNDYEDVIGHMDFVNHPVDYSQGAFVRVTDAEKEAGAVACAIRFSLDKGPSKFFRLADDYDEDMDDEEDVVEMGDEDDEMDDLFGDEEVTEMGDEDNLSEELKTDLLAVGMQPPTTDCKSDPDGFMRELCAALKQKKLDEDSGGGDIEPEQEDFTEEDIDVTAPEFAQMSLKISQAEARAKKAEARCIRMSRQATVEQLTELRDTGRITPAEFEKWGKQANVVKMSLGDDGEPKPTSVDGFIAARKDLPKGAACPVEESYLRLATVTEPTSDQLGAVTNVDEAKKLNQPLLDDSPGMYRQRNGA